METVNQENQALETEQTAERTFTQEEVNAMIDKRFARQWEKYGNLDELKAKADKLDQIEEASKTELQKATEKAASLQAELDNLKQAAAVREIRSRVSMETGVPETLLTGNTEEECKVQADAIKAFANPAYPRVKDGGENHPGATKQSTKQQFAEWANKAFND